ncbi:caffeic acid [Musa troglodytarum]|uniref:Caffeic acid n=1 Tax=Musa troglodytarum TaxID=320322 RepID=A0A9E7F5W9_9LILI|nr:caffeic acid [Musa troglodytarum]
MELKKKHTRRKYHPHRPPLPHRVETRSYASICNKFDISLVFIDVNLLWILHDWTDEQCARILKNCWKALPEEGKVIVVEYLLPVIPEPNSRSQGIFPLDIGMMMHTGGRERTQEEFEAMAKEAGFTGFKGTYISLYSWLLEFTKSIKKDLSCAAAVE